MHRSLSQDMARFGYLARRAQLYRLGYSERDLRQSVDGHRLWPIRRSWLAHQGADGRATRAVALGGRLCAGSALATYGVWVTRPDGLWVAVPQSASRVALLGPGEHRLRPQEYFPHEGDRQWRMSLRDSLAQFARVASPEDVVASFDSALNKGLLGPTQLDGVFDVLPRRLRRLLARINAHADSGLETLLRLAAEAEGWTVEIQARIVGVGHVDVLIDGWLVIELDGARWHDDELSRDEDARRDAELILLGFRRQRFRSSQVINAMPTCIEVIRTILADGRPSSSR
jgi:very-short-patch-repair endonuclease